ncbi:helix-turn-helix domain-containing protein [Nonomuraea dietziae]|uniref:TetR/AcrR family transcriptional regulator n=1 Tax=Nonomuraea dietziae TaxID=65515 RepID=UPI0031DDEB66
MARTTPGVTRDRLLTEAVRLFASKGYDATSVADIQVACGLTAGSGALYKHFPSKGALLEAAVQRNLELMTLRNRETVAEAPADPREALRLMASVVWSVIEGDRDLIRIMLREYHGFSELFERMWQSVIATLYREGRPVDQGAGRRRGRPRGDGGRADLVADLLSAAEHPHRAHTWRSRGGPVPGRLGRARRQVPRGRFCPMTNRLFAEAAV